MQKLKRTVLFGVTFLTLLIAMLYFFQEKFIFLPTTIPQNYTYTFDAEFDEIFIDTPDNARLNALHFQIDNPKGLILYFHGNAGDLSRWGEIVVPFTQLGYEVLVMDYRTYGKSTGKLSEEALFGDAQLFYDYVLKSYSEDEIVIYGRSLGSGIATKLASDNNPKKLILETPFNSLLAVAKGRFPFLPVKLMLKYRFDSDKYIQKVNAPIRIFHGTADNVVPYESGGKLFEAIPHTNKKFYTIKNGEHNNLATFETYQRAIKSELD